MSLPTFRPLNATDCSVTVLCSRTVQLLSHCLSITIPGPMKLSVADASDRIEEQVERHEHLEDMTANARLIRSQRRMG